MDMDHDGGDASTSSPRRLRERQPSELGFDDIMGGEGAVLHARTMSESGPLPPLKPAPGPPPKNMVLLDNVPQILYGRLRYVDYTWMDSCVHAVPSLITFPRSCFVAGRQRRFWPITSFQITCEVCIRSASVIGSDSTDFFAVSETLSRPAGHRNVGGPCPRSNVYISSSITFNTL